MSFFSSIAGGSVVRGVSGLPVTPTPNTIEHDVYIIPQYGQSLALNQNAGTTTFSGTEPLSYNISLVNDNGKESVAGLAEAFQIAATEYGVTIPANFKIVGFATGNGGTGLTDLSKGTSWYNGVINNVQTAKNNCDTAGLTCIVPCFTWTQGEEDMRSGGVSSDYGIGRFDPFTYSDRLKQLVIDFNTDIKAITGQTEDIFCVSYQVATHHPYGRYPRIAIEQADLANEYSLMHIAKTMYNVDYSGDKVHAVARTYRYMGNMYGLAAFQTILNPVKHKHVKPISHVVNGAEITVTFDVPVKPLVFDTIQVTALADGNYGFDMLNVSETRDGNGTITESISTATTRINSVVLSGEDKVVLTLTRTPVAGERLTYAYNTETTNTGRIDGSRGNLRDSQNISNNNTGATFNNLSNWCVIFEIEI